MANRYQPVSAAIAASPKVYPHPKLEHSALYLLSRNPPAVNRTKNRRRNAFPFVMTINRPFFFAIASSFGTIIMNRDIVTEGQRDIAYVVRLDPRLTHSGMTDKYSSVTLFLCASLFAFYSVPCLYPLCLISRVTLSLVFTVFHKLSGNTRGAIRSKSCIVRAKHAAGSGGRRKE